MKKQVILLLSIVIIQYNINADIMTELAKRDRQNPISITEFIRYGLYASNGYLHTGFWQDGFGESSIVAYKIQEDSIQLIVRIITWDFAYRIYDYLFLRDGIDEFTVVVHDYYLVELLYINGRLETYSNRVRDINTNGFIFNDAKINSNVNEVSIFSPTSPPLEMDLTEGLKVKITSMINERTNALTASSHSFQTYDYYYHILVDDKQVRINGYLLDFGNKIDYRAKLLILGSGNTPQVRPPEEALDYFGTWRYHGTGGMGFDRFIRTITITISADEFNYHFDGYENKYGYTLTDLMWTRIIRPDEDFRRSVEMPDDDFNGVYGYLITGTVINRIGSRTGIERWPDTNTLTQYIYLRPDDKDVMLWYNYYVPNYLLIKQK